MISQRALEIATAALTATFGAAVAVSSLDNGISWSTEGVGAGTFPFIAGVLILGGSLVNLALGWRGEAALLLGSRELVRLARLFVPAALYVAAIPWAGMYVASAAYVWGTISLQRSWSQPRAIGFAVLFALALYAVFERTFEVSLPHGALGDALGW